MTFILEMLLEIKISIDFIITNFYLSKKNKVFN
jgi:hypothetical protein